MFFVVAIHFDKQELEVQYQLQYEVFFVQYSSSQILPKYTKGNFNVLNPVHTTEGILRRRFGSENVQIFSVHSRTEKFENATIKGHFGFGF